MIAVAGPGSIRRRSRNGRARDPGIRPRPLPPPRRLRPRDRCRGTDDRDGADRQPTAVHLLPAQAPLRAELPRPSPPRRATAPDSRWSSTTHLRTRSPRRSHRRSAARSITGLSRPTALPGPRASSPSSGSPHSTSVPPARVSPTSIRALLRKPAQPDDAGAVSLMTSAVQRPFVADTIATLYENCDELDPRRVLTVMAKLAASTGTSSGRPMPPCRPSRSFRAAGPPEARLSRSCRRRSRVCAR